MDVMGSHCELLGKEAKDCGCRSESRSSTADNDCSEEL